MIPLFFRRLQCIVLLQNMQRKICVRQYFCFKYCKAVALADKLGNDKVINATVGSILDEEGNLVVLNVVQEEYKKLTPRQYAAYAPIQGYHDI